LPARPGPSVHGCSPSGEPHEQDDTGPEPGNEPLDPGGARPVFVARDLLGRDGRPFDEVGHPHAVARERRERVPIAAYETRVKRRGPEPVPRPGEPDAGVGGVETRIQPADEDPEVRPHGVGQRAGAASAEPDPLVVGHELVEHEAGTGQDIGERVRQPARELTTGELVAVHRAVVVADLHGAVEGRIDAQGPVEMGERHREPGARDVQVARAGPGAVERSVPERQVLQIRLHTGGIRARRSSELDHGERTVECDRRPAEIVSM